MQPLQSYLQARYGSYKTNPSLCLFNHRGISWAFLSGCCLSEAFHRHFETIRSISWDLWCLIPPLYIGGNVAHPVQKFLEVCRKKERKVVKNPVGVYHTFEAMPRVSLRIDIHCVWWRMVMVTEGVTSNRPAKDFQTKERQCVFLMYMIWYNTLYTSCQYITGQSNNSLS